MIEHYAVIGNPVAHSKSPLIHAAFARQTHQHLEYGRILGNLDDFAGDVRGFIAMGGRGLNVTVPFKEEAWQLLADRSPRAEQAGAINTLIIHDDGRIHGDNTDGVGFLRDVVDNHGYDFTGKRVLLLGAGGAARGLVPVLLTTPLAQLTIANRTANKAAALATAYAAAGPVTACELAQLSGHSFDFIINATATGLTNTAPPLPPQCLAAGAWVYDLLYRTSTAPTACCQWATQHGAALALDGLGMLIEQAAESFWLWRGVRPDTAPVIAALREPVPSAEPATA